MSEAKMFGPSLHLHPKCCTIWLPEEKAGQKCCCIGRQVFSCLGWEMDNSRVRSNTVLPWAVSTQRARLRCCLSTMEVSSSMTKPAGSGDSLVLCARPSRQPGSSAGDSRAALSCFHLQRFQVRSNGWCWQHGEQEQPPHSSFVCLGAAPVAPGLPEAGSLYWYELLAEGACPQ